MVKCRDKATMQKAKKELKRYGYEVGMMQTMSYKEYREWLRG